MKKPIKIKIWKLPNDECEVTFHNIITNHDYMWKGKKKKARQRNRKQKYGFFDKGNMIELTKIN